MSTSKDSQKIQREKQRADALRENLKRRKDQARQKTTLETTPDAPEGPDEKP